MNTHKGSKKNNVTGGRKFLRNSKRVMTRSYDNKKKEVELSTPETAKTLETPAGKTNHGIDIPEEIRTFTPPITATTTNTPNKNTNNEHSIRYPSDIIFSILNSLQNQSSPNEIKTLNIDINHIQEMKNLNNWENNLESNEGLSFLLEGPSTSNGLYQMNVNKSSLIGPSTSVGIDDQMGADKSALIGPIIYMEGDIFWGQCYNFCYWPCMVWSYDENDPSATTINTGYDLKVSVRFFCDKGRSLYIKPEKLIAFQGEEYLNQLKIMESSKNMQKKKRKVNFFEPKPSQKIKWNEAILEAKLVLAVSQSFRKDKYIELLENQKPKAVKRKGSVSTARTSKQRKFD